MKTRRMQEDNEDHADDQVLHSFISYFEVSQVVVGNILKWSDKFNHLLGKARDIEIFLLPILIPFRKMI